MAKNNPAEYARTNSRLQAVFWDFPQFTDEVYLRSLLAQSNQDIYFWIMARFLEYGRVIDTLRFFNINEIAENLDKLNLKQYNRNKWQRMVEIYADGERT